MPNSRNNFVELYLFDHTKVLFEENILNDEDISAAEEYKKPEDRLRFERCRIRLKKLLSEKLSREPLDILIKKASEGKPYLPQSKNLKFNISHSGDYCLIGISEKRETGVDLEILRDRDHQSLSGRYFSNDEIMYYKTSSNPLKAFFNIWTRKEACAKASGRGLRFQIAGIDTSPAGMKLVNLSSLQIMVDNLSLTDNFSAAVALEGNAPFAYEVFNEK